MAERKPFLLRIDRAVLDGLQRWAGDDLRSLNAQIEFVLRRALEQAGRLKPGRGGLGGPEGPPSSKSERGFTPRERKTGEAEPPGPRR
ncbi:MAG: hypothetical protein DMF80_22120 [Acidobacteria bacterium]|nr:MAG: hypothetical protein DMF80_22120 [Acidobacteriota bacterium]PYQ23058.1 MAG: hypothetical protein DMF81_09905 [Acidobacteriota bacterium]